MLVACGIIPAPACVPGNGSSAYTLLPPLNATYSVADVFANVIDLTADPGYDSFYLGVYTAGQAHEPSLRPYLRGQARAGAAGRVASAHSAATDPQHHTRRGGQRAEPWSLLKALFRLHGSR